MLKKLTLALLLGSTIAQPLMATTIDTVALKACQGALQGVQHVDMASFINCLEKAKEANSNQLSKAFDFVSEHTPACIIGGLLFGTLFFYNFIWPDVGIRLHYTKLSRSERNAPPR